MCLGVEPFDRHDLCELHLSYTALQFGEFEQVQWGTRKVRPDTSVRKGIAHRHDGRVDRLRGKPFGCDAVEPTNQLPQRVEGSVGVLRHLVAQLEVGHTSSETESSMWRVTAAVQKRADYKLKRLKGSNETASGTNVLVEIRRIKRWSYSHR